MVQEKEKKFSLRYIVLATLLMVGVIPPLVTGWFLSDRSGRELRAAEGRYQTELVSDKANRIEMFGRRYIRLVNGYSELLEFDNDSATLFSAKVQQKIASDVKADDSLLALFVRPIQGKSLSAFRSETINQGEIEKISADVLGRLDDRGVVVSQPQTIDRNGEIVLAVASPVYIDDKIAAAVIAITSLNGISKVIVDKTMTEAELWDSGAPIIFVVDQQGRAIYHPNSTNVKSQQPLDDLRIVQEWVNTNNQIQSALLPFSVQYKGESRNMIGSYSTAVIGGGVKFGVIVMQDEERALASVAVMKRQTWMISGVLAFLMLVLGTVLARQMTSPLLKLVAAVEKIASGDLSNRISTKNITEIGTLGKAVNTMSEELEDHIAKLAEAAEENRELFVGTVKALAAAIDGKDRYTRGHSERVSRVSVAIGQRLGLDDDELEKLRISSLLHDIGKIAIDDAILKKPSALTDAEYEVMKTHPQQGYKIMKNIPAMKDFLPGMYMHHEMINGKGYPQGLSDEEIPLQAKIVSVADTFDAMTIDRPYQKALELPAAIDLIKTFVGTRYDIRVVNALVEACADGQIGVGRVKLRNHKQKQSGAKKRPNPSEAIKAQILPAHTPTKTPDPPVTTEQQNAQEATKLQVPQSPAEFDGDRGNDLLELG